MKNLLQGILICVFFLQGSQKELLNLSQQDYANRIEELNQSLKESWAADQKVKALKIVIQVGQQLKTLILSPNNGSERNEVMMLEENLPPLISDVRSSVLSSCPTQL